VKRVVTPAPVPLSGFLNLSTVCWQARAARPCFMPLPLTGLSLQSLPLTGIAHPSRGRWLPRGYPPTLQTPLPGPCHRWFPRHPRSRAAARFPQRLWAPFPRAEARFPVPLGPSNGTRPSRQASSTSKLCSSCESVHAAMSCPTTSGRSSPGFFLSRVFASHTSEPRTRPGLTTRACLPPKVPARLEGPEDPSNRVRPPPNTNATGTSSWQLPTPFEAGPHRLSAATPSPSALKLGAETPHC
jgi:hypothetical protein